MVYNKELDKCLWKKTIVVNKSKFKIGIYHYQEEGQQKRIGITRYNLENEFVRLGRFNLEEINVLLPILDEAKKKLGELENE